MDTIHEAACFAVKHHGEQMYAGQSYSFHLRQVVRKLAAHGFLDADYLAAAWLHDVVEDTPVTIDEVREKFGRRVAALVWAVTGIGHNRRTRNENIKSKLELEPHGIPLKCADRLANHDTSISAPDMDDYPSHHHIAMYLGERVAFSNMVRGYIPVSMWDELQRQYTKMEEIEKN